MIIFSTNCSFVWLFICPLLLLEISCLILYIVRVRPGLQRSLGESRVKSLGWVFLSNHIDSVPIYFCRLKAGLDPKHHWISGSERKQSLAKDLLNNWHFGDHLEVSSTVI